MKSPLLTLGTAFLLATVALLEPLAAEAPPLGKEVLIKITSDLPRRNSSFYCYEFTQTIQQGDRFRFSVKPVRGADMRIQVVVLEPNPRRPKDPKVIQRSLIGKSVDWTLQKRPAGDEILVRIRVNSVGEVRLKVDKVED